MAIHVLSTKLLLEEGSPAARLHTYYIPYSIQVHSTLYEYSTMITACLYSTTLQSSLVSSYIYNCFLYILCAAFFSLSRLSVLYTCFLSYTHLCGQIIDYIYSTVQKFTQPLFIYILLLLYSTQCFLWTNCLTQLVLDCCMWWLFLDIFRADL